MTFAIITYISLIGLFDAVLPQRYKFEKCKGHLELPVAAASG